MRSKCQRDGGRYRTVLATVVLLAACGGGADALPAQSELLDKNRPARTRKAMRWLRHLLCCVLVATWAVTSSASQSPPVNSDQQILIELERSWNEAFYRKDIAFIENILADDFIATYEDGSRGDKAGELALVAEFNQRVESAIQDGVHGEGLRRHGGSLVHAAPGWDPTRAAGRSDASLHRRVRAAQWRLAMRVDPEYKGGSKVV